MVLGGELTGQLGQGPTGAFEVVTTATRVASLNGGNIKALLAGGSFSASLGKDARISIWGGGSGIPRLIQGLGPVAEIKVQGEQLVALGEDGRAWTWATASPASKVPPEPSEENAFKAFAPDARILVKVLTGTVVSATGKGIADAQILAERNPCTTTSASGRYVCVLPRAWHGTLQAVKPGLRFNAYRVSGELGINASAATASNIDFAALAATVRITGRLLPGGPHAKISASGIGTHCLSVRPTGQYACIVPQKWHGTLTATQPGYVYRTRTYASIRVKLTDQDFVGQRATGRNTNTDNMRPSAPATASSLATPTPLPTTPAGVPPAVASSATALSPALAKPPGPEPLPQDLQIIGTIYAAGFGDTRRSDGSRRIANAVIHAEGARCTPTDDAGNYVCTVKPGWSGKIEPRKPNYRFTPSALKFMNLRQNQTRQDFAATYAPNEY